MPAPCPKCGQPRPSDRATECPACGVFYARARRAPLGPPAPLARDDARGFLDRLAPRPPAVDSVLFWGRIVAFGLLALWAGYFLALPWRSSAFASSFTHGIHLVFHEAGHVLFSPFGRLMTLLGGSLLQVLVPLVFSSVFFFKYRNAFAAAVCLAWAGQSLMDVAPYIADARILDLPLLGEMDAADADHRADRHDWHNILGLLGWLRHDTRLGHGVHWVGAALVVLALAWAALVLWRQWGRRSALAFED